MKVNRGRIAAARALVAAERGAHVEDVLERETPPDGPDRGQAWYLAMGVLRMRSHLDAAIRITLRKPLQSLDPEVRTVLRLGAFEKLFAWTPDHAAVDQGVSLVRILGKGSATGLVNASLRRIRNPRRLTRAETLNHPAWLVDRWTERYGEEPTNKWCIAAADPPPLYVVTRPDDEDIARTWRAQELMTLTPITLKGRPIPGSYTLQGHKGSITHIPGFIGGRFWVQDANAVAVTDLLGDVRGKTVLDACAAPGGKTFRLATQGGIVTSVDVSADRLELLKDSSDRLRVDAEILVHDWELGPMVMPREWDRVLVDAPCSALGLTRRHPELRWRRVESDLPAMATRQRTILEGVVPHVAPRGVLVYAVCSPEPEEGEQVVDAFLADHPEFTLDRVLHLAPPEAGVDAFHAARLVRA